MKSSLRRLAATVPGLTTAGLYGQNAARVLVRAHRKEREERLVFVLGSPRSGTTMFAGMLGAQPGLVDLGEVKPLKASIARIAGLPEEEAAREIRTILERIRGLALSRRLRAVEQTPEVAHVLPAALAAYPQARAVHMIRDGRDVVCSLLAEGWLSRGREGADDAGLAFGDHARFWVEPERLEEFGNASDATRAAWAWRRYLTAARSVEDGRVLELRYEHLVGDPAAAAREVAAHLTLDAATLEAALGTAHGRSVGRWERDLTAEQIADVEHEAGDLLRELGYL